jgi:hypothetical protein
VRRLATGQDLRNCQPRQRSAAGAGSGGWLRGTTRRVPGQGAETRCGRRRAVDLNGVER